jgi:hypothetical protein
MAREPDGAGQQHREIPKGAEFQTARNPKSREIPKGARTAREADRAVRALWNSAPFGIQRLLEFSAVWDFAVLLPAPLYGREYLLFFVRHVRRYVGE